MRPTLAKKLQDYVMGLGYWPLDQFAKQRAIPLRRQYPILFQLPRNR